MVIEGKGLKKRITTLALPALLATCAAQADLEIDLHFDGYGRGGYEQVAVDLSLLWDEQDASGTSYYNLKTFEHLWTGPSGENYISQCIEVYQGIDPDQTYTWKISDVSNDPLKKSVLEDLYSRWIDPLTGGVDASATNNSIVSAFQIMVWEITHENFVATTNDELKDQIRITEGAIQWDPAGDTETENYFLEMYDSLGEGGWQAVNVNGWRNGTAQDQANYQIPAPSVLALMGFGMAGIARRRRK